MENHLNLINLTEINLDRHGKIPNENSNVLGSKSNNQTWLNKQIPSLQPFLFYKKIKIKLKNQKNCDKYIGCKEEEHIQFFIASYQDPGAWSHTQNQLNTELS